MLLQKPAFLLFYHARAAEASFGEWLGVLWHGLSLDCTVAGYVTAFPVLVVLASFWIPLSQRVWRIVLTVYFSLIALVTAAIFAVDLNLYGYWGFRLDGSVLIYLSDPGEALASASWGEVLRQILIMLVYAGAMIWSYRWILRLFRVEPVPLRGRVVPTVAALLIGGLTFLAIRGGVTVATANVSKVYFSSNMFLNHAATNPVFSFLSSVGDNENYAEAYPFFEEERRKTLFEELRGNRPGADAGTPRLLRSDRPNVVLILLESLRPNDHGRNGERRACDAQHAAFQAGGCLVRKLLRQFVPYRPGTGGRPVRISGPNDHVDHEAAAKKRHAAFAGPFSRPGRLSFGIHVRRRPELHQPGFVHVFDRLGGADLAEGYAGSTPRLRNGAMPTTWWSIFSGTRWKRWAERNNRFWRVC